MSEEDRNFYQKGIRFECQGSGKCCVSRGSYGKVYMSLSDRRRMAEHLGLKTAAFTREYCEQTGGWYHLKQSSMDCRFLENKGCNIYEARPDQCRTWPFWPENLNAKTWSDEIASFCPGVGKGKLHSADEIEEQLKIARAIDDDV